MSDAPCATCGCAATQPAHALLAALRRDDLDLALEMGLLDATPCPDCAHACAAALVEARDARLRALAARARYRARAARLLQRAQARARQRAAASAQPAALPPAAAAALARAQARAAQRKPS